MDSDIAPIAAVSPVGMAWATEVTGNGQRPSNEELDAVAFELDDVERAIACLDRAVASGACEVCVGADRAATLAARPVLARCSGRFDDVAGPTAAMARPGEAGMGPPLTEAVPPPAGVGERDT